MDPLSYRDAALFFLKYSAESALTAYGILGGMPAYLEQFDPEATLADNAIRRVLSWGSMLYEEVHFLLCTELRETSRYHAALTGSRQEQRVTTRSRGPSSNPNLVAWLSRT